ncbi:MAG TPA: hypothetical protein EYP22_04330 [Methanosarcinales archaeon]|nr:hypothetical protein [Methanosarcinales archaeon]
MADINLIINIVNIVLGIAVVILCIYYMRALRFYKKWIGLVVLLSLHEILLFMEYFNQIFLELSRTTLIIAIIYTILYIPKPLVQEKIEKEKKKKEREIFQHKKENLTAFLSNQKRELNDLIKRAENAKKDISDAKEYMEHADTLIQKSKKYRDKNNYNKAIECLYRAESLLAAAFSSLE